MVGSPWVQVSMCDSTMLAPSLITLPRGSHNYRSCLPARSTKRLVRVFANSDKTGESPQLSSSETKNPLAVILEVPQSIWRHTLRPLSDFGFSRGNIWEGGVGLFFVSGAVILALTLFWLRGFRLRSGPRKYEAVFEFAHASGICMGTPVRIRGVTVGNVIRIKPALKCVEAIAEVEDDKIIIPQNSLVEVNQSGLLMEAIIDITPRDPLPKPRVGPLDVGCIKEGLIVCDRQKIKGCEGVSMNALIGIFTRLGRDMEEIGVTESYKLAEKVASVIEEAKPLLAKIEAIAEDFQPLLTEVRNGGLLKEFENLTKSLTQATEDLRMVHSSVMTPENTELMQKSIHTLVFTLKNIEKFSSDILGFTGDETTRRNLKLLIRSLSRMF